MKYVTTAQQLGGAIASLGLILQTTAAPQPAQAQARQDNPQQQLAPTRQTARTPRRRPQPPAHGTYVARRGGASRSCANDQTLESVTPLVPSELKQSLIPTTVEGGFTTQARPQFWFQMPFEAAAIERLEFVLQDDQDEELYRSAVTAPAHPGLLKVALDDTAQGLEVGQRYRWILQVVLNCGPSTSEKPFAPVQGWIERYEPNSALLSQLQGAEPLDQVRLYQSEGIWFDALNLLAPLRLAEPSNPRVVKAWDALLSAYAVAPLPTASR